MIPLLLIFVFDTLVLLVIFAWLPSMQGASSLFGVRVAREYYLAEGQGLVWRFRKWLVAITFVLLVLILGTLLSRGVDRQPDHWDVIVWGAATLSWMLVGSALFVRFSKVAELHRLESHTTRVVASMKIRRLQQYTSPVFESLIAGLVVLPVTLLIASYSQLPDRIPAHYDLYGNVDRWTSRSLINVFMLPLISIWMHGLLWMVRVGVIHTKMPLPAEHTEEYRIGKEQVVHLTIAMMDWLRLDLAILLGAIACNLPAQTLESWSFLRPLFGPIMIVSGVAIFVVVLYYLVRISNVYNQLDQKTGQTRVMTKGEEAGWIWGGAIYYNPEDPSIFVEKKIGIGFTMNFARTWAWLPIVYLLVGLIGILVFAVTLKDR